MPSFEDRLSDEQIQDVAAYVADASAPDSPRARPVRPCRNVGL